MKCSEISSVDSKAMQQETWSEGCPEIPSSWHLPGALLCLGGYQCKFSVPPRRMYWLRSTGGWNLKPDQAEAPMHLFSLEGVEDRQQNTWGASRLHRGATGIFRCLQD